MAAFLTNNERTLSVEEQVIQGDCLDSDTYRSVSYTKSRGRGR